MTRGCSVDEPDPWWRRGLCAELGPDLFFVSSSGEAAEARRACFMCPVQHQCLADALESGTEHGVFGGFTRDHRRMLRIAVENGADPMKVAHRAIHQERTKKRRVSWKR